MNTKKIFVYGARNLFFVFAVILALTFTACGFSNDDDDSKSGWKWTAVADSTIWQYTNDYGYTFTSGIYAIVYGGDKWVAGGDFGKMAYSSNGTSWTPVANSTFGDSGIADIVYGGGKFVAIGGDGKMAYSADGENWTAVSNVLDSNNSYYIYGIAYGNGTFVAGGTNGKMGYSTDCENWTTLSHPDGGMITNSILDIAYGGGRFVAVGGNLGSSMVYSDDDGETWTKVANSTFGMSSIGGIVYGNDRFIAWSGSYMAYSTDGKNWTAVAEGSGTSGNSIAYGNGRWVAVGDDGKISYSKDGESWTPVWTTENEKNSPFITVWPSYTDINAVAYGDGKFIAGGDSGKMAYADWGE